jgi:glycosyltransferase involved in cell wall biosynthesis
MSRGRVLVVTLDEPFPFGQANGLWCHALLKGLTEHGYDVRCLSASSNAVWAHASSTMFEGTGVRLSFYPNHVAHGQKPWARQWGTFRQPFSYRLTEALRRDLDVAIRQGYDVLHLEQLWTGYLAAGRERTLTSIHHLEHLDLAGIWRPSGRFLFAKWLIRKAERRLLARLRHLRTTTAHLAAVAWRLNPRAAIYTVPIALDPSLFEFNEADRTSEPIIGLLGSMQWPAGYAAAQRLITRIFPLVRARCPNARLLLVGWDARHALARYVDTPGVEIIENVPEAKPYFYKLQVFAYPLPRGSGMMASMLEAMAYGIPVVTTSEGAEGLAATDGIHACIAEDDDLFAERAVQLLQDAALRQRLRRHARHLVEACYAPGPTVGALEKVYHTL